MPDANTPHVSRRRRAPILFWLALLSLALILLSACGGDEDSDASALDRTMAAATEAEPADFASDDMLMGEEDEAFEPAVAEASPGGCRRRRRAGCSHRAHACRSGTRHRVPGHHQRAGRRRDRGQQRGGGHRPGPGRDRLQPDHPNRARAGGPDHLQGAARRLLDRAGAPGRGGDAGRPVDQRRRRDRAGRRPREPHQHGRDQRDPPAQAPGGGRSSSRTSLRSSGSCSTGRPPWRSCEASCAPCATRWTWPPSR